MATQSFRLNGSTRGSPLSSSYLSLRRGKIAAPQVDIEQVAAVAAKQLLERLRTAHEKRSYFAQTTVVVYFVDGRVKEEAPINGQKDSAFVIRCTLNIPPLVRKIVSITASLASTSDSTRQRRDTTIVSETESPFQADLANRMKATDLGSPLVNEGCRLFGRQIIDELMSSPQQKERLANPSREFTHVCAYLIGDKIHWQINPPEKEEGIFLGNFRIDHQGLSQRKPNPVEYVSGGDKDTYPHILDGMNQAASARYEEMHPNPLNMAASVRSVPSASYYPIGRIFQILIAPSSSSQPTVSKENTFQGDSTWLRGHAEYGINPILDAIGAIRHSNGWLGVVASAYGVELGSFEKEILAEQERATTIALHTLKSELEHIRTKGISKATTAEARTEVSSRVAKILNDIHSNYNATSDPTFGKTYAKKTLLHLSQWARSESKVVDTSLAVTSPNEVAVSHMERLITQLEDQIQSCRPTEMKDLAAKASLGAANYIIGELSIKVTNDGDPQSMLQKIKEVATAARRLFFYGEDVSFAALIVQEDDTGKNQLTICSIGTTKIYLIKPSGDITDLSFHSQAGPKMWKMSTVSCSIDDQIITLTGGAIEILRLATIGAQSPRPQLQDPVAAESHRANLIESMQQALQVSGCRNFLDFFKTYVIKSVSTPRSRKNTGSALPQSFGLLAYASPRTYWRSIGERIINELASVINPALPSTDIWVYLQSQKLHWQTTPLDSPTAFYLGRFSLVHKDLEKRHPHPISYIGEPHTTPECEIGCQYALEAMNQNAERLADSLFSKLTIDLLVQPNRAIQPLLCTRKGLQGDTYWLRGHNGQGERKVPNILAIASHEKGWFAVLADGDDENQNLLDATNAVTSLSKDPLSVQSTSGDSMTVLSAFDHELTVRTGPKDSVFLIKASQEIEDLTLGGMTLTLSINEGDQVVVMTEGAVQILRSTTSHEENIVQSLQEALALSPTRNLVSVFRKTLLQIASLSGRGQASQSFALLVYPPPKE